MVRVCVCACVHIGGDGGQRRGWNTQPESVFVPQDLGGEAVRAKDTLIITDTL